MTGVQYTPEQMAEWARDLERIRAVVQRLRIIGTPDIGLERGCDVLERRLAAIQQEAER